MIAQHLLGQRAPIFAPIAAVVCLTDAPGVRGRRAVRLLGGVIVGVAIGEAAVRVIGTGWLQIAVSLAVGMLIVSLASINPLTMLQAGIAASLVVGTASAQTGWTRLFSAMIGGVLALVVSQLLAAPSPTRVLGDAAARALGPPQRALCEAAAALRERSASRAGRATEDLRVGHETLAAFLDTRSSARSIATSTLRGRHERYRVEAMQRRFGGIEYVYAGSVLLTRTATELVDAGARAPEELVQGIENLAAVLDALRAAPTRANPSVTRPLASESSTEGQVDPVEVRQLATELTGVDPAGYDGPASELATQLRLVAEDVASLTDAAALPARS